MVIPKKHNSSYAFAQEDNVLHALVLAAKKVGLLLDTKLPDVGRTGLILEGFGVDHLHAKLIPMHGTKQATWKPIKSNNKKYFKTYEGYLSSHDYNRADDKELYALAKQLQE